MTTETPETPAAKAARFGRAVSALPGVAVTHAKARSGGRVQATAAFSYPAGLAALCRLAARANCTLHVYEYAPDDFRCVVVADDRALSILAATP